MQELDRLAVAEMFFARARALNRADDAMAAYWAGRIDGHCLQNAITAQELQLLAASESFEVDWNTAMGAA